MCCHARVATAAQTRPQPGPKTATQDATNAVTNWKYVEPTFAFAPSAHPGVKKAARRAPASPPRLNGGASCRKKTPRSVGNSINRNARRSSASAPPGTVNRYARVAVAETYTRKNARRGRREMESNADSAASIVNFLNAAERSRRVARGKSVSRARRSLAFLGSRVFSSSLSSLASESNARSRVTPLVAAFVSGGSSASGNPKTRRTRLRNATRARFLASLLLSFSRSLLRSAFFAFFARSSFFAAASSSSSCFTPRSALTRAVSPSNASTTGPGPPGSPGSPGSPTEYPREADASVAESSRVVDASSRETNVSRVSVGVSSHSESSSKSGGTGMPDSSVRPPIRPSRYASSSSEESRRGGTPGETVVPARIPSDTPSV